MTPPDVDVDAGVGLHLPESGTGERSRRRRERRRRARVQRSAFGATVAVLTLAVPVLAWIGFREVVQSKSGRLVDQVKDPDTPGFEAVVERTPTSLLVQLGDDGTPISLTVLALNSDDAGGAVLFVPVNTLIDLPDGNVIPLSDAYGPGGLVGVRDTTALVVGIGFDEANEVDSARLAALVEPVAPLTVQNPDDLVVDVGGADPVTFAAGPLQLAADEVGLYLSARAPDESDLARLARQEAFWEAWLEAVDASADPAVVPGETSSGLGRFVRGLAGGAVRFETLPVAAAPPGAGEGEFFEAQDAAVDAVLADLVPFPVSPAPGARPRVRLLDGGPDPAGRDQAAHVLVRAGAEIDIVGNADRFGYEETSIVYYDPEREADAQRLQEALGTGTVRFEQADSDRTDVTVILGSDFLGVTAPATTGDGSTG